MSLPVYFAPLQGYTDVVYRKAHAALFGGIAAYYTPFVRIEKGDFRRKDLRDIDFENNRGVPVVPQAICCITVCGTTVRCRFPSAMG